MLAGESQLASLRASQIIESRWYYIGLTVLYQNSNYKSISTIAERKLFFRWTDRSMRTATTFWYSCKVNNTNICLQNGISHVYWFIVDNPGGPPEYCIFCFISNGAVEIADWSCTFKMGYICQPKINVSRLNQLFRLEDASLLGSAVGGCFNELGKVSTS